MNNEVLTVGMSVLISFPTAMAAGLFQDSYIREEKNKRTIKKIMKEHLKLILTYVLLGLTGGILFSLYQFHVIDIIRRFLVMYTVIAVAGIDREKYVIPNKAVLFLMIAQVVLLVLEFFFVKDQWLLRLVSSLLGLLIGGITFMIGYLISKKGMGLGDVKLLSAMGFCLGDSVVVFVIMLSLIFSALYGVVQIIRKKLKAKDGMPYAPFVAVATTILLLLGF